MPGRRRYRLLYLIPMAAVAANLVLAVLCLVRGRQATEQIFAGFLFHRGGQVAAMQRGGWQGPAADVAPGDRVLAIDGRPVADGNALARELQRRRPGDEVTIAFERRWDGRTIRARLELRQLTRRDIAATFVLPFVIGVTYLLIGALVLFVKRTYEAGLAMSACLVASVFYLTMFDAHTSYHFSRLWLLYPLLGPISLHLFAVFPREQPSIHRRPVLGLAYGLGVAVLLFTQLTHHDGRHAHASSLVAGSFLAVCFLANIAVLTLSAERDPSEQVRNKARAIRVGLLVTIFAGIVWSLVIARVYPELITAERVLMISALFPLLFAYAVIKQNIFDLDIFLRTTTIYVIATALVALVYLALVAVLGVMIQAWTERYYGFGQSVEAVAISTIAAALLFHPARLGVQRVVDRYFFREKEAMRRAVAGLERELSQTESLPDVARLLTERLRRLMRCSHVALLAAAPDERSFELVAVAGDDETELRKATVDGKLLTRLLDGVDGVDLPQAFDREQVKRRAPELARMLEGVEVSTVLPLRVSGVLVGVLVLGARAHGDVYTGFELRSLGSLAPSAALALRNTLLLREHAARERLAALGKLAAVIIHEIKNPLGIIKVSSGTLRKRFTAEDTSHELASFIEDEADRMNRTIAQFLAFARPQPPKLQRVDLAQLVRRTLRAARGQLTEAGLEVDEELSPDVVVEVDPDQLQQVLHNLLNNAREALAGAGDGDGVVTVTVARLGSGERPRAMLAVTNDGPPVDPSVRRRIFEPFVTTRPGGTGLGLAIARQLLHEQGGRLELHSRPGATTFTVTLPLAPEIQAGLG